MLDNNKGLKVGKNKILALAVCSAFLISAAGCSGCNNDEEEEEYYGDTGYSGGYGHSSWHIGRFGGGSSSSSDSSSVSKSSSSGSKSSYSGSKGGSSSS